MEEPSPVSSQWELVDITDKDDSLQFFKEEKVEGAVYNVYLKKVRYHSSSVDDVRIQGSHGNQACQPPDSRSRFYRSFPGDDPEDDGKARLQWRLQEIRVIKHGSVARLVEALGAETGDIDSNYVNTFLATYRTFSTADEVLRKILDRYRHIGEDTKMKQQHKDGHRKSLRTVLSLWLAHYTEDFNSPPHYRELHTLRDFTALHLAKSDLAQRCVDRIQQYERDDDRGSGSVNVEDITLDLNTDLLSDIDYSAQTLARPVDLMSTPAGVIAQQLTYIDAELFLKVTPHHCLGSVWSRRDKKRAEAASVYATVNQFNAVSYRLIASVLKHPYLPPTERVYVLEKWIDIAQELRILKNFSSLKAIVSGLQSNPVYRLKRVWAEVSREHMSLFTELAEIFSEDNNQFIARELLNREGTAKFADPDSTGTIKGHGRSKSGSGWGTTKSGGWGTTRSNRKSTFFSDTAPIATGTIPYLGTFLTDLTMIDTALKDSSPEGLVNLDKKRKEFEVLAQIRMLQASAQTYRIRPEAAFFEWFYSMRVYDDNESYEISCEIEPVTPSTPKEVRGHRKKSSLGFFSPRRPASVTLEGLFRFPSTGSLVTGAGDQDSISVISAPELDNTKLSVGSAMMKHSVSNGSLSSLASHLGSSPWRGSSEDTLVVKVYLETVDSHSAHNYKSIMVTNSDHTRNVTRNILDKFGLSDKPDTFVLYQVLPDKEIQLPERGNVFYAISTHVPDLRFVARRRSELDKLKSRKVSKSKLYKFTS